MFIGCRKTTIGADGMLAMPDDWRAEFGVSGFLFAGWDSQSGSIGLFPERSFEDRLAKLDANALDMIRQNFVRVVLDEAERFALPVELLEWAKIESAVEMVGCIDHIKVRRR